jgi:tetratricopeptide (TPR) repeat protein
MTTFSTTQRRFLILTLLLGLLPTALPGDAVTPHTDANLLVDLWRDPAFQRQFLGTYGVRSEIEPTVTVLEKAELEKFLALMTTRDGQAKAKVLLHRTITPAHSATFDFTLGNLYFQEDKLPYAAAWYQKAISKFPKFLRAHKNLGIVHVRAGRYAEAIPALTKAVELGAFDGLTFGMLGYACAMTERQIAAESAYRQAMLLQPEALDWQLGLARCLFRQRKFEEAAALCSELIGRDPERVDYWLLEANAFLGLKRPLSAAQNYEHLDRLGLLPTPVLSALADIYVNEGLMDLAADTYLRALEKETDPDASRVLRNAEVLAARGAGGASRRLLAALAERSTELGEPERKRMLKLQARLAAAEGQPAADQVALLEQIAALDPLDGDALVGLGQHYASTGDLEKAVFFFERAAGLEKYEADARLRHGQTLVRAGRYADALPLLKRSQELRPRDDVARYVEQVERVARAKR